MRLNNKLRGQIVDDIIADVPQENLDEQIETLIKADAIATLPQLLKDVLDKDRTLEAYLSSRHTYIAGFGSICVCNTHYQMSTDTKDEVNRLIHKHLEQRDKLAKLRKEINGVLLSFTTVKAFIKKYPEFEKYVPKQEVITENTPAPMLLTHLMQAGWRQAEPVGE